MKDDVISRIGVYGQMHYQYLKKNEAISCQSYADERNVEIVSRRGHHQCGRNACPA